LLFVFAEIEMLDCGIDDGLGYRSKVAGLFAKVEGLRLYL
jgi:hypothetical protein